MTEREAHIGFSKFIGVGPLKFKHLVEYFGTAVRAWECPAKELSNIGFGQILTQKFQEFRRKFNPQVFENDLLTKEIKIVTRVDGEFPKKLLEIADPPIALFVKGALSTYDKPFIGIVGTRKPTSYGREVTIKFTQDLAYSGFGIVSGMARGIDGIAHQAVLSSGGYTIAVLGCGVDIIYPPEHRDLYHNIIKQKGAVISEVPPGHTVLKGLFPARNRIISGLSLGVLVTEGAKDSGSLITARMALEQGREVFAVPGPITSYLSAGPTKLIKQGAKLVTQVEDIFEELNIKYQKSNFKNTKQISIIKLNGHEKTVVDLLSQGEMHYDEIVRESGLAASQIGVLLTQLELAGIILPLGNGTYSLK